jgi:MSHA pilin protein MshA
MLKMMQNKKGFTLIELVMVIVILGILAAVAIPRYVNLQTEARVAAVNGLAGSVRAAGAIVHASSIIAGTDLLAASTVTAEGQTVNIVFGYPRTAAGGIDVAVSDYTGFTFAAGVFTRQANCLVTYVQPAAANTAPTITVTTLGC